MNKREQFRAWYERVIYQSWGSCGRCRRPWSRVQEHVIRVGMIGNVEYGCFTLCETCWQDSDITERIKWFALAYQDNWVGNSYGFEAADFLAAVQRATLIEAAASTDPLGVFDRAVRKDLRDAARKVDYWSGRCFLCGRDYPLDSPAWLCGQGNHDCIPTTGRPMGIRT